jgi:hypothetical protein
MLHRDCSETLDLVADRRKGEWTMKPVIAADPFAGVIYGDQANP